MSRCLRGADCEATEYVDGATVGGRSDRALCRACEQATRSALGAAPGLWVRLRNASIDRLGGSNAPGTRVRRSRSGSFGLNAGPLTLADNLWWQVTGWADVVLDTADRPAIDRQSQPEGGQVQDACLILARYLTTWVGHGPAEFAVTRWDSDPDDPKAQPTDRQVTVTQAGWEACAWLISWRTSAERLLRVPLLVHYPPEPCPQCDTVGGLRREDGADIVRCVFCRKQWTLEAYEVFVHAWMRGAPAPQPAPHRGPGSATDGHDTRRGAAAYSLAEGAA